MSRTILITGVSGGLGRAMAIEALARGHRVAGTLRDPAALRAFEALSPGRAIGRLLDVCETERIAPLVASLEDELGAIDVLINNAGYGQFGVLEALTPDELRRQLEVNVVGPLALIRAVLPGMRARGAGHIVNVTSMGACVTFPGLGAYHASKFALQGLSDTLAQEVAPFGIRVTALQPGLYRSAWQRSALHSSTAGLTGYEWVDAGREELDWGDPAALAEVVASLIEAEAPPGHLAVGPTALRLIGARLRALGEELGRWAWLSQARGEG